MSCINCLLWPSPNSTCSTATKATIAGVHLHMMLLELVLLLLSPHDSESVDWLVLALVCLWCLWCQGYVCHVCYHLSPRYHSLRKRRRPASTSSAGGSRAVKPWHRSEVRVTTEVWARPVSGDKRRGCHTVTLSYCHTVILAYCHTVTLSHCRSVTVQHFHSVTECHTVSQIYSAMLH